MAVQEPPVKDLASSFARTARDAFMDQAEYFRSLPDDAWNGPTGCSEWTMHDLAGHIVGEAVWFPNLVRGVTMGEQPLPPETWEELKQLSGPAIADRMAEAAGELVPAVEGATTEQLEQTVDFGPARLPLWQVLGVCLLEAVVHDWDARVGRDPGMTIPTPWVRELSSVLTSFVPMLAHGDALSGVQGRYLLQVGDGVGPIMVTADDDGVSAKPGQVGTPDVAVHLTADQFVRLLTGRLPLGPALDRGEVTVEGSRTRAEDLNRVFAGVGH